MLLGCIADDLTGATDMALMLSQHGMRTVQVNGLPEGPLPADNADAIVIALKSRTIPAAEAVAQSVAAAQALLSAGASRLYFKYCSTFDSTDKGNIGPVSDALMSLTGADFTIACPAFPKVGRSIYMGHLFVNGVPLNESSMRDHPLTPMRDSDLRRVIGRQTNRQIGHVPYGAVASGATDIRRTIAELRGKGDAIAVVDALDDAHLEAIAAATSDLPLLTGGSGLALGLPKAYLAAGLLERLHPAPSSLAAPTGRALVVAGSCSEKTLLQVRTAREAGMPAFRVDPRAIADGTLTPGHVATWLAAQPADGPALVYSSDDPGGVGAVQGSLGRETVAHLVEDFLATVATGAAETGFTRFLVAGGETSGAVVGALGVSQLAIGPEIDPGVPWTRSRSGRDLALALKSGNFGAPDFFLKAWSKLQ